MIPANRAKFIQLSDGTTLEDAIEALRNSTGSDAKGNTADFVKATDLEGYAKTEDVARQIEEAQNTKLKSVKQLADDADLATIIATINGLISDLRKKEYMN